MQIESIRPTMLQVTLHSLELATLIAAARWVAEGQPGELHDEAVDKLRQVLAEYDAAWQQREAESGPPAAT